MGPPSTTSWSKRMVMLRNSRASMRSPTKPGLRAISPTKTDRGINAAGMAQPESLPGPGDVHLEQNGDVILRLAQPDRVHAGRPRQRKRPHFEGSDPVIRRSRPRHSPHHSRQRHPRLEPTRYFRRREPKDAGRPVEGSVLRGESDEAHRAAAAGIDHGVRFVDFPDRSRPGFGKEGEGRAQYQDVSLIPR
jgi:hypothetical protein